MSGADEGLSTDVVPLTDDEVMVLSDLFEYSRFTTMCREVERILAARVAAARADSVRDFVQHIASNAAYNGASDPGQRFYDECLNPWLDAQATAFLAPPNTPGLPGCEGR